MVGSVALWVAMPYNDLVLRNAWIGDAYLPLAPMALLVCLVLMVNPLLRWVRRRWVLSFAQLAVVLTVLMIGAIPVGTGLLHWLPYGLTTEMNNASTDQVTAKRTETANLRPCLFPGEFAYGVDAPAA